MRAVSKVAVNSIRGARRVRRHQPRAMSLPAGSVAVAKPRLAPVRRAQERRQAAEGWSRLCAVLASMSGGTVIVTEGRFCRPRVAAVWRATLVTGRPGTRLAFTENQRHFRNHVIITEHRRNNHGHSAVITERSKSQLVCSA